ncbi:SAC3/GANP/Nin1/mts3/eIF-3 p25 family-domain-containing protein [Hypoxylon fuscum]|nr:SAC3/GANP/Nin1/mts3/eIF-3 p25 family-domain-containing protein [Hypoxylon fuscum]
MGQPSVSQQVQAKAINPFAKSQNDQPLQKPPNGIVFSSQPVQATPPNPFGKPTFGAPSTPTPTPSFGTSSFGSPSGPKSTAPAFGKPAFGEPSGVQKNLVSTPPQQETVPANSKPFAQSNPTTQESKPKATANGNSSTSTTFPKPVPTGPSANNFRKVAEYVQPAWPKQFQKAVDSASASTRIKRKNEDDLKRQSKFSRSSPDPEAASLRPRSFAQDVNKDMSLGSSKQENPKLGASADDFARKIRHQLARDNIKPPQWPANPGSYEQRHAIERFREAYKAYREKARKSLMRADLIDDPDKRRRLKEALVFKGICEDMCPEWEKITRIVEHDVRRPEKKSDQKGDLVAIPSLMVKRLARSAAGQDAPLPMDVRSVATLRRTLDYLVDELIPTDDLLSSRHSFLWDRTRALRIDFSFQKYSMTAEEYKDQVYCLETITRFHVTALHLLSQDGFTPADFSEQQEKEQLGKTLLSLVDLYDDCAQHGIKCENEAEFRGHYIIFNAHIPALSERIANWDGFAAGPDRVKAAISIVQSLKNIRSLIGPLFPGRDSVNPAMLVQAISVFFNAVAMPAVSYTAACFAEIHFIMVRKAIVKAIRKSFSRPRFGPKDLTPALLKQYLWTDTEEEAVEFFRLHGFQFSDDGYAMLSPGPTYIDAKVPHSFSRDIVERKRCGRSLPTVIHETVYEVVHEDVHKYVPDESLTHTPRSPEESLFVSDELDTSFASSKYSQEGQDSNSKAGSSETTPPSSPPTATSPSPPSFPSFLGKYAITRPPKSSVEVNQSRTTDTDEVGSQNQPPSNKTLASTDPFSAPVLAQSAVDNETQPSSSLPSQALAPTSTTTETNSTEKTVTKEGKFSYPWDKEKEGYNVPAEKSEHKSPTPASSSFGSFPEPLPKTCDSSNKDKSQLPLSSATPTPGPKLEFLASATPTTSPFSGISSKNDDPQPSVLHASPTLGPGNKSPSSLEPLSSATQTSVVSTPLPSSAAVHPPADVPKIDQPASTTSSQPPTLSQPQNNSVKEAPATAAPLVPPQPSSSLTTTTHQNAVQSDPMKGFTRWFVRGDGGLMDGGLQQVAVEHALKNVFDEFQRVQAEQKRKEEDEQSWIEARKFREYSLKVKFYYRWHNGFRQRQRINRMKQEREKARQWKLPENVAKRERAAKRAAEEENKRIVKKAKDSIIETSRRKVNETIKTRQTELQSKVYSLERELRRSTSYSSSLESKIQNLENALLATGVFKGVRDERASARRAARECCEEEENSAREKMLRLQAENQRRRVRGLPRLKELPEPKAYKEGSKTAMLRSLNSGAGRDALSVSTGSLRNSTFSSSYRSSLGYNTNRVEKSRTKVTNPYWKLKARGLVRMPNGDYLPESIALPMLEEGKRFPGFGDYGLPPVQSTTPNKSPQLLPSDYSSPLIQTNGIRADSSSSAPGTGSQKRKRRAEDEGVASNTGESPTGRKRARSGDREVSLAPENLTDGTSLLSDIQKLMNRVESIPEAVWNSDGKD